MSKIKESELKRLFSEAEKAKKSGTSLGKVFETIAAETGRAKGSVRNAYYSTLKKSQSDERLKKNVLGNKTLSVTPIICFNDSETDKIIREILSGATLGKSVRRMTREMAKDEREALRFQNKYRNALRCDRTRVERIRSELKNEVGRCYDPYEKKRGKDLLLEKLKAEINALYERIAQKARDENRLLKEELMRCREELSKYNGDCQNAENVSKAEKFFAVSATDDKKI